MNTSNSISNSTVPGVLKGASIIIILAGLMAAQSLVLLILLAIFISIVSAKPIFWLETKKVPHYLAIAIVLITMIVLFLGLGGVLGKSITNLTATLPEYEQNFKSITQQFFNEMGELGYSISSNDIAKRLDSGRVFRFFANTLSEIGSFMSDSVVIIFIVVFMLLEINAFAIKAKVASALGGRSMGSLALMGSSIRQYLWIKTLMSILTGLLITVWLTIVGVDYAILWGLIAFMLNYIPNIGSIIAAVPATLFAVVQLGFGGALWTLLAFVAVNNVVGNMVEPKVTGEGLGLSTLVVFLSLIIWGYIFGTVGMFLSVPITIVIKIALEGNPKTRWIAVMLGTEKEAKEVLLEYHKNTGSTINQD